jgi:RNA polymerase sigma-70 factor (ECF subfamily)
MPAPSPLEPALERTTRAFERLAEPLRRELKAHCYRMLGSLHEAEDAVQETYLRGWRSFQSFDGRGPLRAWLYRIATNVCLDALARGRHIQRLLPEQLAPATLEMPRGTPARDIAWLEPYPDSELEGVADEAHDPEARYAAREAVELAFVAVIQTLPPRQRAALLLCDVLGWSAAEAATLLGGSLASINSALQRSRETLGKRYSQDRSPAARALSPAQEALLGRYVRAWEGFDLESFVSLLKEDASYAMPPMPQWYEGREAIRVFFGWAWKSYAGFRLARTAANGRPAFALYSRAETGAPWTAHSIHALSLEGEAISALTFFVKPDGPRLFPAFGLPLVLPDSATSLTVPFSRPTAETAPQASPGNP